MQAYLQPGNVRQSQVNDAGLTEINFGDASRFVGQASGDRIEGRGTLHIQDLAKIEGKFFGNKIIQGTMWFASSFFWDGTFDDEERLANGTLELTESGDKVSLRCVEGQVTQLQVLPDGPQVILSVSNGQGYSRTLDSGVQMDVSTDSRVLRFGRTFGDGLLEGDQLTMNLGAKSFFLHHFEFNRQRGVQKELYLGEVPYTRVFTLNPDQPRQQKFRMSSAKGVAYESETGWARGVLRESGRDYVLHGGLDGDKRSGPVTLAFNRDNTELGLTYLQDKVAFDSVEAVFEFVKGCDFGLHPHMRHSEALAKVKFIESLDVFEGAIHQGTAKQPVLMVLTNGLTYKGRLKDYKMDGRGSVFSEKWEATGEFVRGELRFGVVKYNSGANYEGQLLEFRRHESGRMYFANGFSFQGRFREDRVSRKEFGLFTRATGYEAKYLAVDLEDFDLCVFVPQKEADGLFVWSYANDKVYDTTFIDKLESTGLNIRESLRNIGLA